MCRCGRRDLFGCRCCALLLSEYLLHTTLPLGLRVECWVAILLCRSIFLLIFLNHRGQILSRNRLLEEIWDSAGDFVSDNTLTVYIKRLRDKIEADPAQPEIIKTVRGLGYRMEG